MGPKIPDFSDVEGGSSTAPAPGGPGGVRSYTVVAGDTLSRIAQRFYGDAAQWRKVYEANQDIISNPDRIFPGEVLKIPDA